MLINCLFFWIILFILYCFLKVLFLEGLTAIIIGGLSGAVAAWVFSIVSWLKTDKLDLENHKKIIIEELKYLENKTKNINITNPFSILYPKNGRLYDIKLSFVRFKCAEKLSKIYYCLLEVDENIQFYRSLPAEEQNEANLKFFRD